MSAVEAGFFSLTSGAVSGDDAAYLRWHLLDHMPEQYAIPGIRLGTRWRADDECVRLRVAAEPDLEPVRHLVSYLVSGPVDDTLRSFARLGRQLAEAGRYPEPATPHLLGAYRLLQAAASPTAVVSAPVIPFRPHRGVFLLVEAPGAPIEEVAAWHTAEQVPILLRAPGVAGVWTFGAHPDLGAGADQAARFGTAAPWDPGGSLVTLVYVDGELAATSRGLHGLVRDRWAQGPLRPRLAGPFRSPTRHEAWPEPTVDELAPPGLHGSAEGSVS